MKKDYPFFFFNQRDHDLLAIVDQAWGEGPRNRTLFGASLHPNGIMELAGSHAERMALAVINLLANIEAKRAEYRLMALRSLLDEVWHSAQTGFRYNTARVLIQMMKEIVLSRENPRRRMMLVHDFRRAATGNPRIVRQFLRQYRLLEMPETLTQASMDHHVHDANTKGRKNPTHLLMDAWIKGLRHLIIIYYNYISPEMAHELFSAAAILGIRIRIGLEYRAPFKNRQISLIWEPAGMMDKDDALEFLQEKPIRLLMEEGRGISACNTSQVIRLLEYWNAVALPEIRRRLDLELAPLEQGKFLEFVGAGQASTLHLAEMAHRQMLPALKTRYLALEKKLADPPGDGDPDPEPLRERMRFLNGLTPEVLLNTWLKEVHEHPPEASAGANDLPELAFLPPQLLTEKLLELRNKSSIRLSPADLSPEEVLELLWDCQGRISHLENFNLKEWQSGRTPQLEEISLLQQALNNPSPLPLKHIVRAMLKDKLRENGDPEGCAKLREILQNLPALQKHYLRRPLGSRIGTDSTSNASMRHGMGLLAPETLPLRARRRMKGYDGIMPLPIHLEMTPTITYPPPAANSVFNSSPIRALAGWTRPWRRGKMSWIYNEMATYNRQGNIITIGGIANTQDNGFAPRANGEGTRLSLIHLNNHVLNGLKVLLGLTAAMLTFLYTQPWWFLAWFGALIWFTITALRNIAQALLGGGVLRRSLLRWSDYINVSRICDSLMYTGFSVPLLELGMRYLLLEKNLGLTLQNSPALVFASMSLGNGLYIASHNIYRGLPRAAAVGNLFRSILAIPCSIFYHHLLLMLMHHLGALNPEVYLQLGAAIISKTASDTVGGIIEGTADRQNNLRLRFMDYGNKIRQLLETYTRLELAYPEKHILRLLVHPENLLELTRENNLPLRVASIANALDLMYFWNYLPQAQPALKRLVADMSGEERLILARSQLVLSRTHEVSQMFVDGLVGEHFSKALSFYLNRNSEYIRTMYDLCFPGTARDEDQG
ncbi:MAG: hypothetical protein FWG17_00660 [Desulfovibrionaceae bacterium]|nr:hypothetical protein [Desulfovibrionaceae bacterium]